MYGGQLPFTGISAALYGAVGLAAVAAGAIARRFARES